jgi:phage tail protein X
MKAGCRYHPNADAEAILAANQNVADEGVSHGLRESLPNVAKPGQTLPEEGNTESSV